MKNWEKRPRLREKQMKVLETGMNSGCVKSRDLGEYGRGEVELYME